MKEMEVRTNIEKLSRVKLANLPTPLEEMTHLSKALGGPKLWIKRDDLTGLIFGGNKVRKLEFEMADTIKKGTDIIVTDGIVQSNHACATVAAARKLGMKTVLLLRGEKPEKYTGNLLVDHILGADIRFVRAEWREIGEITRKVADQLKAKGHNPYVMPFSSALGSVGYVNAFLELLSQAKTMNLKIDYIVHAVGSGGTQAGIIVGNRALETEINVIGIATEPNGGWLLKTTMEIADECAKLLELEMSVTQRDVTILHDYVGEGYGVVTQEVKDIIKKVAEIEGILLDPVYTCKAMRGLINLIEQGRFEKQEKVVFLHTGGIPTIFTCETY